MRTIEWNCRGIYNASTDRALRAQIKRSQPKVIFLYETKASEEHMDKVMHSVGFSNKVVVNAKAVKIYDVVCEWIFVGFYGPSYVAKKKKAWENLLALFESFEIPSVCLGDFNFTTNEDEKLGGKKGSSSHANYLQELMFEFDAIDLGFSGNKFTWAKRRRGKSTIKRRLDRAIASISWRLAFPKASIAHLSAIKSDHTPICLDSNLDESFAHRPFRFEAA
nr:hypothetical protein CFP56_40296 [Quercus suber]